MHSDSLRHSGSRLCRTTRMLSTVSGCSRDKIFGRDLREQQSPRPLPGHTYAFSPPHVPSIETFSVDVGVGGELLDTEEGVVHSP